MIEIISGSNRANANSLRISRLLFEAYQDLGVNVGLINLQDLPAALLDPAAYGEKPPAFAPIQERVLAASGLHVVTPEYNGSFPGALKIFIDMLKFPESFESKPVAYVGVAAGQWGGLRSVEQLQMIFGYRNAYSYPRRVFIAGVHTIFDTDGTFNVPDLLRRLQEQAAGFKEFVGQVSSRTAN